MANTSNGLLIVDNHHHQHGDDVTSSKKKLLVVESSSISVRKKKKNPGRSARRRLRNRREQLEQAIVMQPPNAHLHVAVTAQMSLERDLGFPSVETNAVKSQASCQNETSSVSPLLISWRSDREVTLPAVAVLRQSKPQCWNEALDPTLLRNQLGFLPGNAIAVVARMNSDYRFSIQLPQLFAIWQQQQDDNDIHNNNGDHHDDPVVLQLYPLACRNAYAGGKAQGRNFKGRRRGRQAQLQGSSTNTVPTSATPIASEATEQLIGQNGNETQVATHHKMNAAPGDSHNSHNDDDETEAKNEKVVEPFPTLYWLTHPWLRTMVSQLELEHFGSILEDRLAKDPVALASMKRAHLAYGEERFQLLSQDDISFYLQENGKNTSATNTGATASSSWEQALSSQRGVAGIRNFASVKCLHAHVAHYLSGGHRCQDNVVGKWTMDAVAERIQAASGPPKVMKVSDLLC